MTNKQAKSRYMRVFVPAMIGYVVSIFSTSLLINKSADVAPLTYGLALIPAIFVFIWVWAHARYILEIDEFVRMLQIKSVLYGLIVLMGFTTAWGLLEFYTPVPAIPIFYVLPGFYLCYGIAAVIIGRRNNAGCQML